MYNNKNVAQLQKQNAFLTQKINEISSSHKEIYQELIQTKNQLKFQNNNKNANNIESKTEIMQLKSKINEYEIINKKLKLEKQMIITKFENMIKDYQNEINLITNIKDSEIQSLKKIINELKNQQKSSINNFNMNKQIFNNKINEDSKFYLDKIKLLGKHNEQLSKELFEAENENKDLKNQIDSMNLKLKFKDSIIKNLDEKIRTFSDKYNRQINLFEKNNDQSQLQVQQLFKEREQLIKENNELNMGINKIDEKVKGYLMMFNNKNQKYNNTINSYKNKLKEYKNKIVLLKRRIDQLLSNGNNQFMRKDKSQFMKNKNMSFFLPNKGSYSQGKLNLSYGNNIFI